MSPERKVCVLKSSAYANYLAGHEKYKYLTQVPVDNLLLMAKALAAGECDGIVERRMHLEYLQSAASTNALPPDAAEANGLLLVVQESLFDGPQELAAMLGSTVSVETRAHLSHWMTTLVSNGVMNELYKTHVALGEDQMAQLTTLNVEKYFGTAGVQALKLSDMAG